MIFWSFHKDEDAAKATKTDILILYKYLRNLSEYADEWLQEKGEFDAEAFLKQIDEFGIDNWKFWNSRLDMIEDG